MMTLEIFLVFLLSTVLLAQLLMIFLFRTLTTTPSEKLCTFPEVSLIIAVRNEEENIPQLKKDLESLTYPVDKLQILIGNDHSEDNTLSLLQNNSISNLKIFDVTKMTEGMSGKMNVLTHLIEQSTGEYLLFTDGDMLLSADWIQNMLSGMDDNVGMVAGYTGIVTNNLFSHLQNLERLLAQGMLKITAGLGMPQAVSGNNMLVRSDVLKEIGGYQSLKFSLIEDVSLMRKVYQFGYKVNFLVNSGTYIETKPCENLKDLLLQRQRWGHNFRDLPLWVKCGLVLNTFYLVPTFILLFFNPLGAAFFLIFKFFLVVIFANMISKKIEGKIEYLHILLHEFFGPIITLSSLIAHSLHKRTIWKGRIY